MPCTCCCSTSARSTRAPAGRIDAGTWADHLAPAPAPPTDPRRDRAVPPAAPGREPRPATDRPPCPRRAPPIGAWLTSTHPEITSLAQLHREHAEEFLRWLGEQTSQHTGVPLALTTRRSVITLLTRFVNETAAWQWDDVPGRVLFTRGDIPKIPRSLPRFIPDHELAALMNAVDQLPDPYQRAALIVARWSGARRDEIRRLAVDCLDTYPDGHPRLRIPVGKGHTERSIPLHPQAAEALQPLIDARRRASRTRPVSTPAPAGPVQHMFVRPRQAAVQRLPVRPGPQGSLHRRRSGRPTGGDRPSPPTDSGTPSAPNSPKAAPASKRSWPCSAIAPRTCRSSTPACPTRP